MGHIRLGILPKTHKWKDVIEYLGDPDIPVATIADKTLDNSQDILQNEISKSSVTFCIWLLSKMVLSAKDDDFTNILVSQGIDVTAKTNATRFITEASNFTSQQLNQITPRTAVNNIAALAFRETLTRTVGIYGKTLFGSQIVDIRLALKRYSTNKTYSNLLHMYFKSFLSRTLRFIIDKEIANHLGPGQRFKNVQQLVEFEDALDYYAEQTARIVDEFSGGWYSKKVWQTGDISKGDVEKFVHVALQKLRKDLELGQVQ